MFLVALGNTLGYTVQRFIMHEISSVIQVATRLVLLVPVRINHVVHCASIGMF